MNHTDATIIRATPDHAEILSELGARTFADTFVGVAYYTQAIVDGYTAEAFDPATIRRELADPGIYYALLMIGDTPAGYARLETKKQPAACIKDLEAIYLARLYLDKAFHRGGLGTRLLRHVFDEGRARGFRHLWLSVWEYNTRAVAFYQKHGFHQAGDWDWVFESHGVRYVDRDWVMTIGL